MSKQNFFFSNAPRVKSDHQISPNVPFSSLSILIAGLAEGIGNGGRMVPLGMEGHVRNGCGV